MATRHDPPDYPVMNLDVAVGGQRAHAVCDAEICAAKRYFDRLVPRLRRAAGMAEGEL